VHWPFDRKWRYLFEENDCEMHPQANAGAYVGSIRIQYVIFLSNSSLHAIPWDSRLARIDLMISSGVTSLFVSRIAAIMRLTAASSNEAFIAFLSF